VERRRDPHAAPSALDRPPRAAAGSFAADVAGPGMAGAAGRDAADRPPRRDAAHRHSRHRLALASRHRPPPLGAPVAPRSLRAPASVPQCAIGGAAAGPGERVMGVPPHSRRTGRARHYGSGVDGMADPQERGDRPGAAPGWAGLAGVLAITGTGDPGAGLLHRRSPQWREDLRPGRNRASHPPRPGPRCHRAPGPVLGRAAGQELAYGPGRCRDAGEVRAARPGRQLHAGVRCRVPGRGRQGHPLRGPGAADETSGCILHLFGAIGG